MHVKIDGNIFYTISGDDLTNNMNEKLLINRDNKIIISDKFEYLVEFIKNNNVFDDLNLKKWLKEILSKYYVQTSYKYALYNFDVLVTDFILNIENTLYKLPQRKCKEYIDFINLIDTYAEQINHKTLMKLRKEKNINMLWEYFYDLFVWKLKLNQIQKRKKLKNFDMNLFRVELSKMYSLLLSNIRYL